MILWLNLHLSFRFLLSGSRLTAETSWPWKAWLHVAAWYLLKVRQKFPQGWGSHAYSSFYGAHHFRVKEQKDLWGVGEKKPPRRETMIGLLGRTCRKPLLVSELSWIQELQQLSQGICSYSITGTDPKSLGLRWGPAVKGEGGMIYVQSEGIWLKFLLLHKNVLMVMRYFCGEKRNTFL